MNRLSPLTPTLRDASAGWNQVTRFILGPDDRRPSPSVRPGRIANSGFGILILCGLVLATSLAAAPLSDEQQGWVQRAERHARHGWIYLHVEGPAPERGFQYGYRLAREINASLRAQRKLWEYTSGMDWDWLVARSTALILPKVDAEDLAELEGIAAGMNAAGSPTTREEMVAYNAFFELDWYWWPKEKKKFTEAAAPPPKQSCSSFIATGHLTKDGNIVLGHNSMVDYPEAGANVVLDVQPEHGHRILMQTWPGWIHSGTDFFVTDAGLVGSETTIGGFTGFDETGVPEFARMRRATQDAGSIEEWCAIMKRRNNGGYANAWLLGDIHTREIARLELGLKYAGFEKKRDGYFVGSNVAEALKVLRFETDENETDIRLSSVARRVRWEELMGRYAGRIDVPLAERFEADHYDPLAKRDRPGGRSLCGHFELDREAWGAWPGAPYYPAGTFDGKVVDATMARAMSFVARWGSACGRAFDAPRFLAAHPQFGWMRDILKSRPSEPWTVFRAGERGPRP